MGKIIKDEQACSDEEKYMGWYLDELVAAGFIDNVIFQPEKGVIIPKKEYSFEVELKTKTKKVNRVFLSEHTYKPDFVIDWNLKAENVFTTTDRRKDVFSFPFYSDDKRRSIIDVKGTFNQNDAHRRFSVEQKLIYHLHDIYIQKIITAPAVSKSGKVSPKNALFLTSFIPFRYLTTDKSGDKRKIRFKYKLLNEYLNSITP